MILLILLQREPTVRVVAVSHPTPLRYISVSKGGQITVWSSSLHSLKSLGVSDIMVLHLHTHTHTHTDTFYIEFSLIQLAGDPTEEVAHRRRFRGWTTDAVCMGNVHRVVVATDCRDLHFVNVSTASVFEDVHLFGIIYCAELR